jgi:hypothetical protein
MAPGGSRVLTPFGDADCARQKLDAIAIAAAPARPNRCNIGYSSIWAWRKPRFFVYHFARFFLELFLGAPVFSQIDTHRHLPEFDFPVRYSQDQDRAARPRKVFLSVARFL